MMRIFRLLFCGLFSFFSHAHSQITSSPTIPQIDPSEKQFFQIVVEGNNRFAFDFFEKIKNTKGNFCFSPCSLISGLGLAAVGAKGETAQQLQSVLNFSLSLLPLLYDLNRLLETPALVDKKVVTQVWLAADIWLNQKFPLLPSFKIALKRNFDLIPQQLDFEKETSKAVQVINQWVSQKTNQKIKMIVSASDVPKTTQFLLTTAMCFKGAWAQPFDQRLTKRLPFYTLRQRPLLTYMMEQNSDFLIWKGDQWDMCVLPYQGGSHGVHLAMAIILPKERSLEELEQNLTLAIWKEMISQLQQQNVLLTVPNFRVEERFELAPFAKAMGWSSLFDAQANFSGMTDNKGVYLSKGIHKALIHIDEEGSDTLRSTTRQIKNQDLKSQEAPYPFNVNRPFMFVIYDQNSGAILLMGHLTLP